jgi:retinol dehydrogenase-12
MQRKTCVITGPTAGIGRASSLALARQGFRLVMVARSREKAEALKEAIQAETPDAEVDLVIADLGVQKEIRRAAGEILALCPRIDVLLNNAGVMQMGFEETPDGLETTLAVNHLAYFLLTDLLLERIIASAPARIVSVASNAHTFADLDLEDLEFRDRKFRSMRVYGTSKLLNIQWNAALARRLEGTGVTANSLHPGGVNTGLGDQNNAVMVWVGKLIKVFMKSPETGAKTSVHLATSDEVADISGRYWANCRQKTPSQTARDEALQECVWEKSQALVADSG